MNLKKVLLTSLVFLTATADSFPGIVEAAEYYGVKKEFTGGKDKLGVERDYDPRHDPSKHILYEGKNGDGSYVIVFEDLDTNELVAMGM